ncbi:helix-turn-helix domain-containing protein [Lachnoclostridium phytofermentans]|nr:helix-turn-helix transcriptional regulator [Lachnoclostridium phytofermentans]
MEFKDILQMIRKERKLSQEEVAEKIGVSRQKKS